MRKWRKRYQSLYRKCSDRSICLYLHDLSDWAREHFARFRRQKLLQIEPRELAQLDRKQREDEESVRFLYFPEERRKSHVYEKVRDSPFVDQATLYKEIKSDENYLYGRL